MNTISFYRKILACFRIGSLQEHYSFYALEEINEAVLRHMWRTLQYIRVPNELVDSSVDVHFICGSLLLVVYDMV